MKTTAPEQIQIFATLPAERAGRAMANDTAQGKGEADAFDALVADAPKPERAAKESGKAAMAAATQTTKEAGADGATDLAADAAAAPQAEPKATRLTGQTSPAALEVFWQEAANTGEWTAPETKEALPDAVAPDARSDVSLPAAPALPLMAQPQAAQSAQAQDMAAPLDPAQRIAQKAAAQATPQKDAPEQEVPASAAKAADMAQLGASNAAAPATPATTAATTSRGDDSSAEPAQKPKAEAAQAPQTALPLAQPRPTPRDMPATATQETAQPVQRAGAEQAAASAPLRAQSGQNSQATADKTSKAEAPNPAPNPELAPAQQSFAAVQAQGTSTAQPGAAPPQTTATQMAAATATPESRAATAAQNALPATETEVSVRQVAAQSAPAAAARGQTQYRPSLAESRFEAALAESQPTDAEGGPPTETARGFAGASAAGQSANTPTAQTASGAQAAAPLVSQDAPQEDTSRLQDRVREDKAEAQAAPDLAKARAEINRKKDASDPVQAARAANPAALPDTTATAQSATETVEPFSPTLQAAQSDTSTQTGSVQTANRTVAASPQQIAQQLAQAMPTSPDQPVEVSLSPEELGKVRMTLHSHDGSITVSVQAERPETLDLMRRNIDSLARDFREMGYSNISFDFGQQADQRSSAQDRAEAARMSAPDTSAETERPIRFENATLAMQRSATAAGIGGLDLRI